MCVSKIVQINVFRWFTVSHWVLDRDERGRPHAAGNQPFFLAFVGVIVTAQSAGLNSSSGHMWPPGLSLPTSGIEEDVKGCVYATCTPPTLSAP